MTNNNIKFIQILSALALMLNLTACGETKTPNSTEPTQGSQTQGEGTSITLPFENTVILNGAGATITAPLYENWFQGLNQKVPKLEVNYESVGNVIGVEKFIADSVDFGASYVAMTDEEMARVNKGVLLLPVTAGAIVFTYNLPGVESLQLSRETYVDIALGNITNWNDPKIVADNPNVTLPDKPIIFVHRADGSGTTEFFTKHLSSINEQWKTKVGEGKIVKWGVNGGKLLAAQGNEGVIENIKNNEGSIGYVEFSYAQKDQLPMVAIENKTGKFIVPSQETGFKTLENTPLAGDLRTFITDPEGENSYPIVAYNWILAYQKYDDPNKAIAMEAMIQYALTEGQKIAPSLGFISLPPNVIEKVATVADNITPDYTIKIK
ncbi:phosphate ABC transporter [Geminocystis sp. NIES-3708]|uniref:phosphate ABC transporter substrate-binding protein PstS n=1 Tax=Geminocystis sp. NIES-3708 TaxID=1615909 RepID=UPI0005FCD1C0|nr:phosphate ABC transporter substrate-binding protein PstS [Geminocystis sp. NIES-3708]BAQ60366.1 phosphate ABC transporter [Geminocystis sp. NIES-3708]